MAFFPGSSTLLRSLRSPCDSTNPLQPPVVSSGSKRNGDPSHAASTPPPALLPPAPAAGGTIISSSVGHAAATADGGGGAMTDLPRRSSCSALLGRRNSSTTACGVAVGGRSRSTHEPTAMASPGQQKGRSGSAQRESVDGLLMFLSPVTASSPSESFPLVSASAASEMLLPYVSERRARAAPSGSRRSAAPRSTGGGGGGTVPSSPATLRQNAHVDEHRVASQDAMASPPLPVNAPTRIPVQSPNHHPRTSSSAVASPSSVHSSHGSRNVARLASPLTRHSPIAGRTRASDDVPCDPSRYATICVDLSNCRYDIVRHVFEDVFGFDVTSFNTVPTSSAVTDVLPGSLVYWSDRSLAPMRVHRLLSARCVANHFPGIELLCRKVSMGRFLAAMANVFPQHYSFFPRTYLSYEEFNQATAARPKWSSSQRLEASATGVATDGSLPSTATTSTSSSSGDPYYICKPNGGCCGRDIVITQRITPFSFDGVVRAARVDGERQQDSVQADPCVVQQYIHRPLLVDGRKCDLRCYVLIASWEPLTICFYREGIVRLCASPYEEPSERNCKSMSVHLANYAVNKKMVTQRAHGTEPTRNNIDGGESRRDGPDTTDTLHSHSSNNMNNNNSNNDGAGLTNAQEEYEYHDAYHSHRLKRTFDSYNRFLLQHIQRNKCLLRVAEERHAQRHGKRPSPTPQVLLATSLVEELWFHIHSVVILSILSAYKTIRQQCPPCTNNGGGSTSHSIPHAPPSAIAGGGGIRSGSSASAGMRLVNTASPPRRRSTSTGHERAGRADDVANSSSSSASLHHQDSDEQTLRDANQHIKAVASQSPFFELLGFDILVDEDLKPWLIEINHSPSWSADSSFDTELKRRVLRDALRLCVLPRFCASSGSSAARLATAKTRTMSSALSRQLRASVADARQPGSGGCRRGNDDERTAPTRSWRDFDAEYRLEGNRFHQIFPVPLELRNVEQFKGLTEVCDYLNVRT